MINMEEYHESVRQELMLNSLLSQKQLFEKYRKKFELDVFQPRVSVLRMMERSGESELLPMELIRDTFYNDHSADDYLMQGLSDEQILAVGIARRFVGFRKRNIFSYMEMIESGLAGLEKAKRAYDDIWGVSFSTFASWFIYQAIYAQTLESTVDTFEREPLFIAERNINKYHLYYEVPTEWVAYMLDNRYKDNNVDLLPFAECFKSELKSFFDELCNTSYMSRDDEDEFAERMAESESDTQMIPASLIRLVMGIASEYCYTEPALCNTNEYPILPFMYLFRAGVEGLSDALELYELSMNIHFRTFAAWHIHMAIAHSIFNFKFKVNIPKEKLMPDEYRRVESAYLELKNDHEPTFNELYEIVGPEIDAVREYMKTESGSCAS